MPLNSVLYAKRCLYDTPDALAASRNRSRSRVSVAALVPSAAGGLSSSTNHFVAHEPVTVCAAATAGVPASSANVDPTTSHSRDLPIAVSPRSDPLRAVIHRGGARIKRE